jgi:hypothetical protein
LKTKTTRRRRKRAVARVGWFRGLAGRLVAVSLGVAHRWHGSDLAGDRLVRIVRAKVNRKTRQVVLIVARLYGGDEHRNGGYNGPLVKIDQRREFTGGLCRGIWHQKRYVPIDDFYASLLSTARHAASTHAKGAQRDEGHHRRDRPAGGDALRRADRNVLVRANGTLGPWVAKGPETPASAVLSEASASPRPACRSAPDAGRPTAGEAGQYSLFDAPFVAGG